MRASCVVSDGNGPGQSFGMDLPIKRSRARYWARWLLTWHAEAFTPAQRRFLVEVLVGRGDFQAPGATKLSQMVNTVQWGGHHA